MKKSKTSSLLLGAALATASCAGVEPMGQRNVPDRTPTDSIVAGMTPKKALPTTDQQKLVDAAIDQHFMQHATRRAYIMTDKPLYQPGETIWFRVDFRQASSLAAANPTGVNLQLVSPRGAVVQQKRLLAQKGVAGNDFELAAELEGGEYTLQLNADDGTTDSRKIIVNSYEAPRLKKELEFVRKAYGAGDAVSAAIEIHRATGEAFAGKQLTGVVTVDDVEVTRVTIMTDAQGKAVARFALPGKIDKGDGLLTILADDGGVMESIQKRIPIVTKSLAVALFPEGGDLVQGLPGRVYFTALNPLGKPADVEGRVIDDHGEKVADFRSVHDGMGRFELTPVAGRSYKVEITKPAGITQTIDIPAAKAEGCVLRGVDDGPADAVRVAAFCSKDQTVLTEAVLREKRIAGASVDVEAGKPALVSLPIDEAAQGAVRVTLFDAKQNPIAERLMYHGRGKDLKVTITADKKSYSPRDPVKLHVKTTDLAGRPVQANVGLAVVDDTVLSFADDKSGRILSHLYLEPEFGPGITVEEPNFYFSSKPEAPAAMDALLGTKGWRRFEWQVVFNPPVPVTTTAEVYYDDDMGAMEAPRGGAEGALRKPKDRAPRGIRPAIAVAPPQPAPPPAEAKPAKMPMGKPAPVAKAARADKHADAPAAPVQIAAAREPNKQAMKKEMARDARGPAMNRAGGQGMAMGRRGKVAMDEMDGEMAQQNAGWAAVRVFPVPTYTKGYDGPRTDFRETIFFNPSVDTGPEGTAEVAFYASDAVTSFRAVAEGVSGGGLPGRGDLVVNSKMPVTLDTRLPIEVSSGDKIQLPVSITNETDRDITADLTTTFGASFKLGASPVDGKITLHAGEKRSFFFPLEVVGTDGEGEIDVALNAEGLKDEVKKSIRVVPLGFPFELSLSGTAKAGDSPKHELELTNALPGSLKASVMMYPSPLSTMTQGMEGMIRQPGGCFEQTSSTNYPNVMIMNYLGANDAADPALVQKTQGVLEHGYKLLTGYETTQKGYEWFGHTPGHEALTAYGLMEFEDMSKVYDVDRTMIQRTADWLMSRRDGKGGFQRSSEALDSFGRASQATTDAYIMWALSEAKRAKGLDAELAAQKKRGEESADPYLVALAANTFLNLAPNAPETAAMVKRLAGMQAKDGGFPGAKETITMSGGQALVTEATSLATLALIKASGSNEYEQPLRGGVDWLNGHRSGAGEWGNTQATVLSLKALSAYSDHSRQMQAAGKATLVVNGESVGTIAFEKGRKEPLVWDDVAASLRPGHNTIELKLDGGATLPYTVSVQYRSARPQSSDAAKVAVSTQVDKTSVKLGEGVKVRAHVENRSTNGVPMTLARVGIPGGLVFQTWQLKELRDKGVIDFYETRQREVILYWRALPPSAKKDVDLDLLASVPGTYVAPATSAYLYYTAEDKAWTAPVTISVER